MTRGVEEVGLHHDRALAAMQRPRTGEHGALSDRAQEVRLRLDGRGGRAGRQVEEAADAAGGVGEGQEHASVEDARSRAEPRTPLEGRVYLLGAAEHADPE